jgi:ribose 5-phosphate isomerase B
MATGVAERVAAGEYDQGVVCCWTGTGASIAANKVRGVRAALCTDAATAAGARKWNDAKVATEIVDAWIDAKYSGSEDESLDRIRRAERP